LQGKVPFTKNRGGTESIFKKTEGGRNRKQDKKRMREALRRVKDTPEGKDRYYRRGRAETARQRKKPGQTRAGPGGDARKKLKRGTWTEDLIGEFQRVPEKVPRSRREKVTTTKRQTTQRGLLEEKWKFQETTRGGKKTAPTGGKKFQKPARQTSGARSVKKTCVNC